MTKHFLTLLVAFLTLSTANADPSFTFDTTYENCTRKKIELDWNSNNTCNFKSGLEPEVGGVVYFHIYGGEKLKVYLGSNELIAKGDGGAYSLESIVLTEPIINSLKNNDFIVQGDGTTLNYVHYEAPNSCLSGLTFRKLNYDNKAIDSWSNEGVVIYGEDVANGNVLRIMLNNTTVKSYCTLKTGSDWHEIMTGSDKFSIAEWKYLDITVNSDLETLLKASDKNGGLRIGGNDYTFAGAYIITAGLTDYNENNASSPWTGGDVLSTFVPETPLTEITVRGEYFRKAGDGTGNFNGSIDNTKNNIIRVTLSSQGQFKAIDTVSKQIGGNDCYACYTRYHDAENKKYVPYISTNSSGVGTFPMSDAIAYFNGDDIVTTETGDTGIKQGMLSDITQNGMTVQTWNGPTITKVEVIASQTSKYVRGYAEFTHSLSGQMWRPISLPYNLTPEQVEATFGSDVMICELGGTSSVVKELTWDDGGNKVNASTSAAIAFTNAIRKAGDGVTAKPLRANYPYIIHLNGKGLPTNNNTMTSTRPTSGYVADKSDFKVSGRKADLRDFRSYKFRSLEFQYALTMSDELLGKFQELINANRNDAVVSALSGTGVEPYTEGGTYKYRWTDKAKAEYDGVYINLISTAPVFDIKNTDTDSGVETIASITDRTTVSGGEDDDDLNYYFYQGTIAPIERGKHKNIIYGLAYIQLSSKLAGLYSGANGAKAMNVFLDEDYDILQDPVITAVSGITTATANSDGAVYSISGYLVRNDVDVRGLPKGIYVVNGKKIIIR